MRILQCGACLGDGCERIQILRIHMVSLTKSEITITYFLPHKVGWPINIVLVINIRETARVPWKKGAA